MSFVNIIIYMILYGNRRLYILANGCIFSAFYTREYKLTKPRITLGIFWVVTLVLIRWFKLKYTPGGISLHAQLRFVGERKIDDNVRMWIWSEVSFRIHWYDSTGLLSKSADFQENDPLYENKHLVLVIHKGQMNAIATAWVGSNKQSIRYCNYNLALP